jgi:hypothetical protein
MPLIVCPLPSFRVCLNLRDLMRRRRRKRRRRRRRRYSLTRDRFCENVYFTSNLVPNLLLNLRMSLMGCRQDWSGYISTSRGVPVRFTWYMIYLQLFSLLIAAPPLLPSAAPPPSNSSNS